MSDVSARSLARAGALLAVLALGAYLRFAGLAYEVRHPQHYDDRVFVNNVIEMLAAGNADHRYYEYPGLFFYLLAVPVALAQPERIDDPAAFLGARALVAAFGVLSIALVYRLGRRLAGPGVGLAAALLLAVSPNEVVASHTNRPDIVLQTLTLGAYLCLLRVGEDKRGDMRAGLAIGAATAIKFTGFLLFPSYVLARLQASGARYGRIALVAAIAALVVVALTPYALVHPGAYLGGVTHQMTAHYDEPMKVASYLENLATYSGWLLRPLGMPLAALAAVGAALVVRGGYPGWLPLLVHLPVTVLVMSSAGIVAPRFLIPASGVVFLAAGLGVAAISRKSRVAALILALVAAIMPLRESLDRVRPLLRPSPRDGALDWIEAHLPPGAKILETRADALSELRAQLVGADPRHYELLYRFPAQRRLQLLAPHMDLVITGPGDGAGWSQSLRPVYRGQRDGRVLFQLKVPRGGERPRYTRMEADRVSLDTSSGSTGIQALLDGDAATAWTSPRPMEDGDWIEVMWSGPRPLARVELWIANRPSREPELEILTRSDDGTFRSRPVVAARESLTRQFAAGRPASQVFVLGPEPVSGLRIQVADGPPEHWSLAELELSVRAPAPTEPERRPAGK